jgi:N-methylhydantoinase A
MHASTDIGGTFTDFVILEEGKLKTFKLSSTPKNPAMAVQKGFESFKPTILSHGTTVATNAVLERKGATCALVTTKGFSDILTIARQNRPNLYDFRQTRPEPYVPKELCFEVAERVSAEGKVLLDLDEKSLQDIVEKLKVNRVESVAVSLLYSFLKPDHEEKIKETLQDWPTSISSFVLPEFREYERTSTTVFDAYIKPKVTQYLSDIENYLGRKFYIMQSNGGVIASNSAKNRPVNILLSGPAGGVAATQYLGKLLQIPNLISFDMGGTSADISLIADSEPKWTSEGDIGGLPIRVPMLDITTIGAGGGSIAWIDSGGALRVGPQSAGAVPGPICYGKGGEKITVTDCNLLAGYLDEDGLLNGKMPLSKKPVQEMIQELSKDLNLEVEKTILGIQKVVNSNMIQAIRLTLAKSGLDPRDFALVAFGGAGPAHACSLAKELGVKKVLIPFLPGAFSAYGILVSDIRISLSKSVIRPFLDFQDNIQGELEKLKNLARIDLKEQNIDEKEAEFLFSVDLRYKGQSYEINVDLGEDLIDEFNKKHKQLYGYFIPSEPIELVNVRLIVISPRKKISPSPKDNGDNQPKGKRDVLFEQGKFTTDIYFRDNLKPGFSQKGPCIIQEETATSVIPPGISYHVDSFGVIHMEVG